MRRPLPLVDGAYMDDTRPYDSQDCVNYIPEYSESGSSRTPGVLRRAPGLDQVATIGTGPYRGARNVEGRLFVVSGDTLFQVNTDFTSVSRGTIPGVGRVSMSHNQISGGNELIVVNGNAGYVWNTVTEVFTQITDDAYPGAIVVDYVASYLAQIEPFRRFWFHSNLAAATDYNSLDRYEGEASPDLMVSLLVDHLEVWIFSERTIEIFINTGDATNTFERAQGTVIEQGCAGRFTVQKLDNGVFWLGNDGIVYRADGYNPRRISTYSIEREIAEKNWSQAFSFVYTDLGHKVYYITFPDGTTWGYDVATSKWHRRVSYGRNFWRLSTLTYWNGIWVGGDISTNQFFRVGWDVYDEAGTPLVSRRRTVFITDNQERLFHSLLELLLDTGHDPSGGDTAEVRIRYSDDGGYTFTNYKSASLGALGQYGKRVQFWRLGQTRARVFDIEVSDPVKADLLGAFLEIGSQ